MSPPVTDDVKPPSSEKTNRPANDEPPSAKSLHKVEDYKVLDSKGEAHTFKSVYDGPDSTKRVLVIFIRHFFCGVSFPRFEWSMCLLLTYTHRE